MNLEFLAEHFNILAEAPNGIKKLREMILQLAVQGKLVPQNPEDEPASVMLKRIKMEKEKLIKKSKLLPPIDPSKLSCKLPKDWEWVRVGNLAEVIRGVSYSKDQASDSSEPGLVPILRAHNIDVVINLNKLVFVPSENVREEQYVRQDDVVLAMSSGSKSLVGKAAQVTNDLRAGFGAFCGVVRFLPGLEPKYVNLYFQCPQYRLTIADSSKGIGINNLSKSDLLSAIISIPPLAEQKHIVAKVDRLLALCDELEAKLKQSQSTAETLMGAVVNELTKP